MQRQNQDPKPGPQQGEISEEERRRKQQEQQEQEPRRQQQGDMPGQGGRNPDQERKG